MAGRTQLAPEEAAAHLADAIANIPAFDYSNGDIQEDELKWLGRAEAILSKCGATSQLIEFNIARGRLYSYGHSKTGLLAPLHAALASAELDLPVAKQGAFIPAGDTWNGYAAIVKLLAKSGDAALIVDPYLDGSFIVEFLPLAGSLKEIHCLTSDRYRPSIEAASERWLSDRKPEQGLQIKAVDARQLHDRLIIFAPTEVYLVSQSFKDIAARSPASIQRASPEVAAMKTEHYAAVWKSAELMIDWDKS